MFCKKCGSTASVILRKKDTYCEKCFSSSTSHKFRSCLGKNRVLTHDDTVLLGISGGKGSMVLLNLVNEGSTLETHKKLRIKPICLYLSGLIADQQKDMEIAKNLIQVCNKLYHVDLYIVHITQFFTKELNLPAANILNETSNNDTELLNSKFKELNPTELSDFKTKIMRNLFIRIGKLLNCNSVFTAETTTTLARNLLSNIVLGCASQIEQDIGFSDLRDENVKIFRPLKDISSEEIIYYTKIKNITFHEKECISDTKSMQSLIKSFVVDLQDNFQSTISTVCKTADKIGTHDGVDRENVCQLCRSNLLKKKIKLTALEATKFSKAICYGLVDRDDVMSSVFNSEEAMSFCYGCNKFEMIIS